MPGALVRFPRGALPNFFFDKRSPLIVRAHYFLIKCIFEEKSFNCPPGFRLPFVCDGTLMVSCFYYKVTAHTVCAP